MSKIVNKNDDISSIQNGEFIFCKELVKGMIKKDISSLSSTTFESVINEIEALDLPTLQTLGLDSVTFGDNYSGETIKGRIIAAKERELVIEKLINELPSEDKNETFIANFLNEHKLQSRYFEDTLLETILSSLTPPPTFSDTGVHHTINNGNALTGPIELDIPASDVIGFSMEVKVSEGFFLGGLYHDWANYHSGGLWYIDSCGIITSGIIPLTVTRADGFILLEVITIANDGRDTSITTPYLGIMLLDGIVVHTQGKTTLTSIDTGLFNVGGFKKYGAWITGDYSNPDNVIKNVVVTSIS